LQIAGGSLIINRLFGAATTSGAAILELSCLQIAIFIDQILGILTVQKQVAEKS
jgi:hypothetical protein